MPQTANAFMDELTQIIQGRKYSNHSIVWWRMQDGYYQVAIGQRVGH